MYTAVPFAAVSLDRGQDPDDLSTWCQGQERCATPFTRTKRVNGWPASG